MARQMTITEKILARQASLPEVAPGDVVTARVGLVYTMDLWALDVFNRLRQAGAEHVSDSTHAVVVFDHCTPPLDVAAANLQKRVRAEAEVLGATIYDIGRHGVMHQLVAEECLVRPGTIAVATDSHAPTDGALGAVVVGVGATDAGCAMATGELWFRVPDSILVEISGTFPTGTTSRDVMTYLMGKRGWDGSAAPWSYQAVELCGETVQAMSIDSRLALCNMASDMGVKNAIIAPDESTYAYSGADWRSEPAVRSDPEAEYAERIEMDITMLQPQVACPHAPDNVRPISDVAGTPVDVATIASCSGARLEDLHLAARILEGRRIHPRVRLYVSPASQLVYRRALADGTLAILLEAGGLIEPSMCGPCLGTQGVVLGDGETCISTLPRNLRGRLGSAEAQVFTANPAVVAASAVAGELADPAEYL